MSSLGAFRLARSWRAFEATRGAELKNQDSLDCRSLGPWGSLWVPECPWASLAIWGSLWGSWQVVGVPGIPLGVSGGSLEGPREAPGAPRGGPGRLRKHI